MLLKNNMLFNLLWRGIVSTGMVALGLLWQVRSGWASIVQERTVLVWQVGRGVDWKSKDCPGGSGRVKLIPRWSLTNAV